MVTNQVEIVKLHPDAMIHSIYKSSCGGFQLEIEYCNFIDEVPFFDWGWNIHFHSLSTDPAPDFLEREYYTQHETSEELQSYLKDVTEYLFCTLETDQKKYKGVLTWVKETDEELGESKILPGVLETLQEWLNNEIYGFNLYDLNKEISSKFPGTSKSMFLIDSCWGVLWKFRYRTNIGRDCYRKTNLG
jgi:hypothetical protein